MSVPIEPAAGQPARKAALLNVRGIEAALARRRAIVLAAVLLVTLARSAVFVCWEQAQFDSNQAVVGLMAAHLAQGRAVPVFIYGQTYMLAVEAWLAAPLFLVAGPSVTALKLPLLAINLLVAWLLVRMLEHDAGLRPLEAGFAAMFFVLPGPGTAARLLEASGGTLEPFLYVLLLWLTRERAIWCGLVLGIGFLNREFTIYGFVSLLILAAARGRLVSRAGLRRLFAIGSVAAAVWLAVATAWAHSSAMGPGTTAADLPASVRNRVEIENRLCIDWRAMPAGFAHIATIHWPLLFATGRQPVRAFDIESDVVQGLGGLSWVLAAAMLLAFGRTAWRIARDRTWRAEYDVCAFLLMTGVLSAAGYVIGRCGVIVPYRMRYDMLSILAAVGLAAWYLRVERSRAVKAAWIALVLAWVAAMAVPHGRLWAQYLRNAPSGGKERIIEQLDARGIRYAIAGYGIAYPIDFLTNERIVVASDTRVRIREYQRRFDAHRHEGVRIERSQCAGGTRVTKGIYFCPP